MGTAAVKGDIIEEDGAGAPDAFVAPPQNHRQEATA